MPINYLQKRDIEDAYQTVIDELRRSKDRLENDVEYEINQDRRLADDVFDVVEIALTAAELKAYQSDRSIFNDQRAYDAAIDVCIRYTVSHVALNAREIERELNNRDIREHEDQLHKLRTLEDVCYKVLDEIERRDRRGGRDDRGRGGRGGRDDRDGRGRGRDGRDSRSTRGDRGSRSSGPERATTQRQPRAARVEEPSRREEPRRDNRDEAPTRRGRRAAESNVRETNVQRQEPVRKQEKTIVLASESDLTPTSYEYGCKSVVYNPQTHVVVHISDGDGVIETVIEIEEAGIDMENYEAHELRPTAFNMRRDNGRIVPQVDFTKVPELTDEGEVAASTSIALADAYEDESISAFPQASKVQQLLGQKAEYTVAMGKHRMTVDFPSKHFELLKSVSSISSFSGWMRHLTDVRDIAADEEDMLAVSTMMTYIRTMDVELTRMLNDMITLVFGPDMYVDSFFSDYDDVNASLREEENKDALRQWGNLERSTISSNLRMDRADEIEMRNGLDVGGETTLPTTITVGLNRRVLTVAMTGEITSMLAVENVSGVSRLEFKLTPDFYMACEKFIKYRTEKMEMESIMLVDAVGTRLTLVASGEVGSPIYTRLI